MALVVLPEGTQISGSIGGTTWSRNRYGAYKRSRSVPVNPNTERQVVIRNATRSLAIGWANSLTESKRNSWEHYASNVAWKNRLGQSVFLTGSAMYVRSNVPRLQAGLARVDDAPIVFDLAPAELALVVTATEAAQTLSAAYDATAAWANEDDSAQLFYVGRPVNPGIKFFGGPYRFAGKVDGDGITPPTSPEVLASPWTIAEGQRIWVRTRVTLADGRLSEFAEVNFLAAA